MAGSIATNGRPLIVMSLEHSMEVCCSGSTVALQKYETAMIPAAAGCCSVRTDEPNAPFLLVTPPELARQLEARLLAAGTSEPRVAAFIEQFSVLPGGAR